MMKKHIPFNLYRIAISLLLLLTGSLVLYCNAAVAVSDNTISGTVSRPSGALTSEAIGVQIKLYGLGNASQDVTILAGSVSAAFSLNVVSDPSRDGVLLYSCMTNCGSYYDQGFYSDSGTTWDSNQATRFQGGSNHTGKDLTLIATHTASGTIILPDGQLAPSGGGSITVHASWLDSDQYRYRVFVAVDMYEGSTSVPYRLEGIPDDDSLDIQFSFRADFDGVAHNGGYYNGGGEYYRDGTYYSVSAPGWSTYQQQSATLLGGGSNHTGIDMTVLYGHIITGAVSLPGGETALHDYYIQVNAEYGMTSLPDYLELRVGATTSAEYSLSIPADAVAEWTIYYNCIEPPWNGYAICKNDGGYEKVGFYSSSGTVRSSSLATPLTGDQSYTGIDLTLIRSVDAVLRDEAAMWLGKRVHGDWHMPPAYANAYTDVFDGDYNDRWIQQLADDGITEGCSDSTIYCPKSPVTKSQAVKLILRAKHGGSHSPPMAGSQLFGDVPLNHDDADWIYQAKTEDITTGCGDGSNFCPAAVLTKHGFLRMLDTAF